MSILAGTLGGLPQPLVRAGLQSVTPRTQKFEVAASQTIYAGDVVAISGGVVSQAIALPTGNNQTSNSGGGLATLGIAFHSITTDSNGNWAQPGGFTVANTIGTSYGVQGQLQVFLLDDDLEIGFQILGAVSSANTSTPTTGCRVADLTPATAYQLGRWRGANATTWGYGLTSTTSTGEFKYTGEPYNSLVVSTTSQYGIVWVKSVPNATTSYRQGS